MACTNLAFKFFSVVGGGVARVLGDNDTFVVIFIGTTLLAVFFLCNNGEELSLRSENKFMLSFISFIECLRIVVLLCSGGKNVMGGILRSPHIVFHSFRLQS